MVAVDGWYLDATTSESLSSVHHKRVEAFEMPIAASLYELDVRVASRLIWGASLAQQVDFNRHALEVAREMDAPYVDLPVGPGLVLHKALKQTRKRPSLVVIDLSVAMLMRARRRLGDDGVTYIRASVESLPLRTDAIGSLHSANGLHLFPSASHACAEMSRVLRPDGVLAATTWTSDGGLLARSYKRVLQRLDYINEPAPAHHYLSAFAAVDLHVESAAQRGSLLMAVTRPQ